ncbi:ankyrin repeat and BTB domain containing 1 [Rhinolophus ferrumequinum]|uniref:Ankyrin repeat and BTB domain containing 1 n=1 Tax=Rhinolophus ferrumequinum TaxID=59479 RepID=A0A7J7TPJ7_RHIFE|nr:ankyrin repeat and BTB domain containing 1 [Rhinolophus ferrumequinum]
MSVWNTSVTERLGKQCQLLDLLSDLEAKCKEVSEFVASQSGTFGKVLSIRPPPQKTPSSGRTWPYWPTAPCLLSSEEGDLGELPFSCPSGFNICPDVCFRVEGWSYLCHKAFFCGCSDYFWALLYDHFQENEGMEASGGLPAVTLPSLSPDIFTHVLYYMYTDHTEHSPALCRLSPACSMWPSKVRTRAEHLVSPNTGYNCGYAA